MKALLADPALFTAPYDAGLSSGLDAAGVAVIWATRPLRTDECEELPPDQVKRIYYRGVVGSVIGRGLIWRIRKGASHLLGSLRLLFLAKRIAADIVHLQWIIVPFVDAATIRILKRRTPVVVTVHDLTPYNGNPRSLLLKAGFLVALNSASHLIVHTESAKEYLIGKGVTRPSISVIPHGPIRLAVSPSTTTTRSASADRRWRVVMFGKLQPYKGLEFLVDAIGGMNPEDRARIEVIVAGEPLMNLEPIVKRISDLGLHEAIDLRPKRLSVQEMADLFDSADTFVFPYRHIQASGVLELVAPYRRWLVASDLGTFRDAISTGLNGALVEPGDSRALGEALLASIGRTPTISSSQRPVEWREIGTMTLAVYNETQRRTGKRQAATALAANTMVQSFTAPAVAPSTEPPPRRGTRRSSTW